MLTIEVQYLMLLRASCNFQSCAQRPIVPVLPYAAAPKRQWAALAAFSALMPLLPLGIGQKEGDERHRRSVLFGVKQLKLSSGPPNSLRLQTSLELKYDVPWRLLRSRTRIQSSCHEFLHLLIACRPCFAQFPPSLGSLPHVISRR